MILFFVIQSIAIYYAIDEGAGNQKRWIGSSKTAGPATATFVTVGIVLTIPALLGRMHHRFFGTSMCANPGASLFASVPSDMLDAVDDEKTTKYNPPQTSETGETGVVLNQSPSRAKEATRRSQLLSGPLGAAIEQGNQTNKVASAGTKVTTQLLHQLHAHPDWQKKSTGNVETYTLMQLNENVDWEGTMEGLLFRRRRGVLRFGPRWTQTYVVLDEYTGLLFQCQNRETWKYINKDNDEQSDPPSLDEQTAEKPPSEPRSMPVRSLASGRSVRKNRGILQRTLKPISVANYEVMLDPNDAEFKFILQPLAEIQSTNSEPFVDLSHFRKRHEIMFRASSEEERRAWVEALLAATIRHSEG